MRQRQGPGETPAPTPNATITSMTTHIDTNDPKYPAAAAEILQRYESGQAEANITSSVRDFLIITGLAQPSEIVEENPPSDVSRSAVDLTALDTFIESKRRIGTATGGFNPNPENVAQLDDYLRQSQDAGKGVRTGILTDGKYWLLRWPDAGPINTSPPYGFVLQPGDGWLALHNWLRDTALVALDSIPADRENVQQYLGPRSATYRRDIDTLTALYNTHADSETIKVKRRLWYDLLRAALGEIAHDRAALDGLFIRHTYLSLVIGVAVQASFGIDIRQLAETDPSDLMQGRRFYDATGLSGIIESDFFAWPDEVGGHALIEALARRVARFDWLHAPPDIAAILYETVIPPEERRTLGEYYTPNWLARTMVQELVTDPLNQRVLDPACGSGTFIAEAITHFLTAAASPSPPANGVADDAENSPSPARGEGLVPPTAPASPSPPADGSAHDAENSPSPTGRGVGVRAASLDPKEIIDHLRENVIGIDVHPVAVHLARAAWALAARPAINAATAAGYDASGPVPVYLGDALQLRFRTGDMFAEHLVTIQIDDGQNSELTFPISLVDRAETFDALMSQVAAEIEAGQDPLIALEDHPIDDPSERSAVVATIKTLQKLHNEGRDHIWAYYTRNLVRPVALSRRKVDIIIGNPPWLNYNQTADTLRTELRRLSTEVYGIWAGGRYASNQDVAGLFFARCTDLYLKDGGVIGMVMPHSALQAGQYTKWRTGAWSASNGNTTLSVDFGHKPAWDLERLQPNTFFPVPSSVVFAKNLGLTGKAVPLAGEVQRWLGNAGSDNVQRVTTGITDTSAAAESPYANYARQGATIRPRCLFFVNQVESTTVVQAAQTITVNPRRGSQDKAPWRDLDLTAITNQTIEWRHVFDVHLGETVVPYATLEPLKAVLPFRPSDTSITSDYNGPGGIDLSHLGQRMRSRWRTINEIWESHRGASNELDLLGDLDYLHKLSSQITWQHDTSVRPFRIVYTAGGEPTAAILQRDNVFVDERLYWVTCASRDESFYLLAIVNSDVLTAAVSPLMSKGQFGSRDLHKHLWKLPIPEFDPANPLHVAISQAGETAAIGAAQQLAQLREQRDHVTVTIARREIRKWLRQSDEGKTVEEVVAKLLGTG